jgi:hypothetical protein
MKGLALFSLALVVVIGGAAECALGRFTVHEGAARGAEGWTGGVLWFAALVNLAACWLAFIPFAVARARSKDLMFEMALAAMPVRLFLAVGALLWGLWHGPWSAGPLMLWMVAFYLALLAVETGWMVRLMHAKSEQSAADGSTAEDESCKR